MANARPARSVPFHVAAPAVILVAAIVVFANAVDNGFHLDDFYRVAGNPGIHRFWPPWRHFHDPGTSATIPSIVQFRPLLPLTLSIDYAVAGDSVRLYHATNLLLQAAAGIVVYFLLVELLRHWSGKWKPAANRLELVALAAALMFTIHPVAGIAVNYISARDLILMQLFLMASLWSYARLRRLGGTPLRWTVTLVLLALSIMAKTNAVVAPLLVLLFEYTLARERLTSLRPIRYAAPFAAVVAGFFIYTRFVLRFSDLSQVLSEGSAARMTYALTQVKLHVFHYLANFIWPFRIRQAPAVSTVTSVADPVFVVALILLVALVVTAWRLRSVEPLFAFSALAYGAMMLPESSLFPLHHVAVDYRPYAPSPLLFLTVCLLLDYLFERGAWVGYAVLIGYFAVASFTLNRTWKNELTLWSHSVRYGGDALAHLNLAMSIRDRSDPRVRSHLEEALRLHPNYIIAKINLGLLLMDDPKEADRGLGLIRNAVAIDPSRAQSHYWLSMAYGRRGMKKEAAAASSEAVRLQPANVQYQYQAARDAQNVAEFERSLLHLRVVNRIEPGYANTRFLEGFALQKMGRNNEAIGAYLEFLASNPRHTQANFNLGYALMVAGRCNDAIPYFRKVLQLQPRYDETRTYLARCEGKT